MHKNDNKRHNLNMHLILTNNQKHTKYQTAK